MPASRQSNEHVILEVSTASRIPGLRVPDLLNQSASWDMPVLGLQMASLRAKYLRRIDLRRPPRGQTTGHDTCHREDEDGANERGRITRFEAIEE